MTRHGFGDDLHGYRARRAHVDARDPAAQACGAVVPDPLRALTLERSTVTLRAARPSAIVRRCSCRPSTGRVLAWGRSMYYVTDTALSARFPIYTRANVGEVFPDPVTPLTSDTALWLAELGWRDAWGRMGAFELDEFPDDEFCQLGVLGGYCYLNASLIRLFGERAPGLSWRAMDEQFFGVQPGIPDYDEQPGRPAARPDGEARRDVRVGVRTDDADRSRPPHRSSHDDDRAARPPSRPHRDVRAPAVGALRAPPARAPGAVRGAHLHVVHGVRAGRRDQHHRRCGRSAGSGAGGARRHR